MSSRITRTWVQENTWRCTSCGSEELGRYMKCQKCGSPKERDETDIVPEADPDKAVQDTELLKKAAAGADWECEFCHGRVRNTDGKCITCAAPREAAETKPEPSKAKPEYEVKTNEDGTIREARSTDGSVFISTSDGKCVIRADGSSHISDITVDGRQIIGLDGKIAKSNGGAPPSGIRSFWDKYKNIAIWVAGSTAGALLLVWLVVFLFGKHEIQVKVSSATWVYKADLHQKTLMHGTDWGSRTSGTYSREHKSDGYGPRGDGFNVSCEGKYYGTENCHPHNCRPHSVSYQCNCTSYSCNCRTHKSCSSSKNGFSNCSEYETCSTCERCSTCSRTEYDTCYDTCDVYRDWCSYDYYEWPIVATKTTQGNTREVAWPDLQANGADQRLDRHEEYKVVFVKGEESWTHRPTNLGEFQTFSSGTTWVVDVNRLGQIWPKRPLMVEAVR